MRWGVLLAFVVACGGRIDEQVDAAIDGGAGASDAASLDVADVSDAVDAIDAEAATCKSDGTSCADASECCSGTCDALGACGTQTCPNGPTLCEKCVGASCCTEDLACAADSACLPIWKCFRTCIEANGGSGGAACVNQCMPAPYEPTAYQFYLCGYQQCGGYCW